VAATASLSLPRVVSGLSIRVEIYLINAGLSWRARLGAPSIGAQFNVTEFLDGQTAPNTWSQCCHRESTVAPPSNLIHQRMPPTRLPAQHMGTKQTRLVVIHCCHWLLMGRRPAQKFISLVQPLPSARLWTASIQYRVNGA
jgi:hypothetical protein